MWNQEVKEAVALCLAFFESKLSEIFDLAAEFLTEYRLYFLIGAIIPVILAILDRLFKWHEKHEKQKINAKLEEQMHEKMIDNDSEGGR